MSHGHVHPINKLDNKVPLILVGVLLGAILYSAGEYFHWHWHHIFHDPTVHLISNDFLMWIFFAFLGIEIRVRKVIQAGKYVGMATLGGIFIPPLLAYALTGNVYIAMGAMATDVAFSLAAGKMAQGGNTRILAATVIALMILAVGDDMGGIAVLAGVYAENVNPTWLFIAIGTIFFTYFVGERGRLNFTTGKEEENGEEVIEKRFLVIRIQSIIFWIFLALLNTFVLYSAGVHWVLGGTLAFLLAPSKIKDRLAVIIEPMVPIVLFVFGMVNGAINLLNGANWTLLTLGVLVGGMFGKQIGIFTFGMMGRSWTRRTSPDNPYAKMSAKSVYSLALLASSNGTVAIYFVTMAFNAGFISQVESSQAILGYFLTVPAVLLMTALFKPFGMFKEEET